jgi:hypothetical protein
MFFSKSVIAAMATIITLGFADPLSFTAWPTEPLQAGKPVTLRWAGGAHPDQVCINLYKCKQLMANNVLARDHYSP